MITPFLIGAVMGSRLPDKAIRIGAAVAYFVFAVILGYEATTG